MRNIYWVFDVIKYACINLLRIRHRTAISVLVISLNCITVLLFGGYINSIFTGMKENLIHTELGHVQIFSKNYLERNSLNPNDCLIDPMTSRQITKHLQSMDTVEVVAPRMHLNGMISNGNTAESFVGLGIDPEQEEKLSSAVLIKAGQDIYFEHPSGILVGEILAQNLQAKVGDTLTLMATTFDGGLNAVDVEVTGIMTTGIRDLDARAIRMNLPFAQTLVDSNRVSNLIVLLTETNHTTDFKKSLSVYLDANSNKLIAKSWDEIAEHYHQVVNLFEKIFLFIKIILFIILSISITSIMMMNIMERTREIGTIRSMGASRSYVLSNYLLEGLMLGIIGGILGVVLGITIANGITACGFDMPRPPGGTVDYPLRILLNSEIIAMSFMFGVLITIISSIYPAVHASRIKIQRAIQFAF